MICLALTLLWRRTPLFRKSACIWSRNFFCIHNTIFSKSHWSSLVSEISVTPVIWTCLHTFILKGTYEKYLAEWGWLIASSSCLQFIFFNERFLICKFYKNYLVKILTSSIVPICGELHQNSFNFRFRLQEEGGGGHIMSRHLCLKSVLCIKATCLWNEL